MSEPVPPTLVREKSYDSTYPIKTMGAEYLEFQANQRPLLNALGLLTPEQKKSY
jgi:hypothetical protein